jgi:hypothetical protein
MAARFSAPRAGRYSPPRRLLVLISIRGWVDPRAIVRLEGVGKLKKSTSSGTRTGDLPDSSVVPQPTTLPRAPVETMVKQIIFRRINSDTEMTSVTCPWNKGTRYKLLRFTQLLCVKQFTVLCRHANCVMSCWNIFIIITAIHGVFSCYQCWLPSSSRIKSPKTCFTSAFTAGFQAISTVITIGDASP